MSALPHFNNTGATRLSDPIFANLFEIQCSDIDPILLEEIFAYTINTADNRLELEFNVNEDTLPKLKQKHLQTNRIDIVIHDKHGKILRKMLFYDLDYLGVKTKGGHNEEALVTHKHVWKIGGHEIIDLEDVVS